MAKKKSFRSAPRMVRGRDSERWTLLIRLVSTMCLSRSKNPDHAPGKSHARKFTAAIAIPTPNNTPASTRFEPPSPNANVSPETTIATSESPRAIVLVKAVISTLTAFSHGELPWAKAGIASKSTKQIAINGERGEKLARQLRRTRFMRLSLSPSNFTAREVPGRDISRRDRRATVRGRLFRRFAGRFHPGTL